MNKNKDNYIGDTQKTSQDIINMSPIELNIRNKLRLDIKYENGISLDELIDLCIDTFRNLLSERIDQMNKDKNTQAFTIIKELRQYTLSDIYSYVNINLQYLLDKCYNSKDVVNKRYGIKNKNKKENKEK